jgi:hypothetical protein
MSDLQMDYMLIKRERLDALLRVAAAAREVIREFPYPVNDLKAALLELDEGDDDDTDN